MTAPVHDVVVVGGGAMGSAAAWVLAGRGREVRLLERFEPGHVRGSSHGRSRLFRLVQPEPDYLALATEAQDAWRVLEAESGTRLLTVTGGIDFGLDGTEAGTLGAMLTGMGIACEVLRAEEAAERWPGIRFDTPVLFQPDGGRLDADAAVAALQQAARARGALVEHHRAVTRLRVLADDLVELDTAREALRARHVVVAAGAWAPRLLDGLVRLPRLVVTQEQPAHFTPVDGAVSGWPAFVHWRHEDGPYGAAESYGLFSPGEGVKVGLHATGPVVDPDRRDVTAEPGRADVLREYVKERFPGLDAGTADPVSCLYTSTPSGDFVLDRVGPVTVAAGFSGHGFKYVPAIGRVLADLVTGASRPPARFALAGGGR